MNSFASPQTLATLPVRPSVDDLYSRVLDAIFEQRIHSASRFTEESLAQMFGARRSDMRDVLTRLSHQQIIILRVNHRPRVAELDAEQTRQTLHARRLAEIMLVRLACQRPCAQDLKRLRTLVDNEHQCTERGRAIRLSGEFHLQLAQMAGNAPLAHFLENLVPLTSLAIAQFDLQQKEYCVEHMEILDALERGDAAKAQVALNRHLDYLEDLLLSPESVLGQNCAAG
ncbi:GntR family transcriptional regulator [Pseudomonas sp. Root68]|uniref:GntR family transcriptional regulator n=1 Tax=unclassified Pseudomonas TaxID=196821 RepID=UPI0006F4A260|nr:MULTISPECIES: GntR family transcriptional regulator [unclassified Pseudomonas]KRA85351.1 GntR family transcriptional regulator [Pseudomonas sp. Root68]KRB63141.1 GntR family transcriptional regulator [Pseudomonas sp. Root71]